jgi:threonine aldolase
MRSFGSDNHAPVHPAVMEAIAAANVDSAISYGDDPLTAAAESLFKVHFGPDAEAFLVFNGSAANVLALESVVRSYESVICAASAHVYTDECGAAERYVGIKLVPVPTVDGKLTVESVSAAAWGWGDQHHVQPRVVSITQSTELGTRYSVDEVQALAEWAHERDMVLHMDGARLSNAAAALEVGLADVSTACGVDVLSFGGTKNGLLGAEAVVFLRPEFAAGFLFLRKQAMQLASKMRYPAAQFVALLTDDLWRRNADHANRMAARLAGEVARLPGVRVTRPVEANAVFAVLPPEVGTALQASYPFYVWDEGSYEVRWMTSFDTTDDDVDGFVAELRRLLAQRDVAARPADSHAHVS